MTSAIWAETLCIFGPYAARRVEAGCLWYGTRDREVAQTLLIGVPKQVNRRTSFGISAEALADLNLRVPATLVVVAQLHTHAGTDTTHSPWDDRLVVSYKIPSLVLPCYAESPCNLDSVGLHVHGGTGWVKVPRSERHRWLTVEPTKKGMPAPLVVDTR